MRLNSASRIIEYDDLTQDAFAISARQVLGEIFSEPMLVEMLLCPLMWYGNAREQDMDFGQSALCSAAFFWKASPVPLLAYG